MKEKAFPFEYGEHTTMYGPGMDLRDYFAAKAMQAILSKKILHSRKEIAIESYRYADEMLEVRYQE
jgi:hypothetical protein